MATVGDVLREVLPSGTVCLAGQAALSRLTISAVILRLRGGFADLGPGTLGLINLELLGNCRHRCPCRRRSTRSGASGLPLSRSADASTRTSCRSPLG